MRQCPGNGRILDVHVEKLLEHMVLLSDPIAVAEFEFEYVAITLASSPLQRTITGCEINVCLMIGTHLLRLSQKATRRWPVEVHCLCKPLFLCGCARR